MKSPIKNPIQRINFIEKEPLALTYRKLLLIVGIVAGIAFVISGWKAGGTLRNARKEAQLIEAVKRLRAEQEGLSREALPGGGGSAEGGQPTLSNLLENSPDWSVVLKELTSRMPRSLWLTSFGSEEVDPSALGGKVALKGKAEDASAISLFVRELAGSPLFDQVVLTASRMERGPNSVLYQFEVEFKVGPRARGQGGLL